MTETEPLILLTNDDGIHADGLNCLRQAVEGLGDIRIVAPESERSAIGHAITLYEPIRVREVNRNGSLYGHGVGGTPADAVKLAIYSLLPRKPDLVLSGINNGANLGVNVFYSGTVSAAGEAAILGAPAIALSLAQKLNPPFHYAVPHVRALAEWALNSDLPPGVALSVNLPALPEKEVKGFKLTRQGLTKFKERYEKHEDPRGNSYYWLSGETSPDHGDEESDFHALRNGYVSVTPLFYDLTAHVHASDLGRSLEKL